MSKATQNPEAKSAAEIDEAFEGLGLILTDLAPRWRHVRYDSRMVLLGMLVALSWSAGRTMPVVLNGHGGLDDQVLRDKATVAARELLETGISELRKRSRGGA